MEIIWRNVALFAFLHIGAFYGFILAFTSASWKSSAWGNQLIIIILGVSKDFNRSYFSQYREKIDTFSDGSHTILGQQRHSRRPSAVDTQSIQGIVCIQKTVDEGMFQGISCPVKYFFSLQANFWVRVFFMIGQTISLQVCTTFRDSIECNFGYPIESG